MTSLRILFGLALVVLPTGCPLLQASVEVREVCMTHRDVQVEGIPASGALARTFVFDDLSAIHELLEYDADLAFTRATVTGTSLTDLHFVTDASAAIASGDEGSTLPRQMIYACNGDCPTVGNEIRIPAAGQPDAADYLASDALLVDLTVTGELPTEPWVMDVDVCLTGNVALTIEP